MPASVAAQHRTVVNSVMESWHDDNMYYNKDLELT